MKLEESKKSIANPIKIPKVEEEKEIITYPSLDDDIVSEDAIDKKDIAEKAIDKANEDEINIDDPKVEEIHITLDKFKKTLRTRIEAENKIAEDLKEREMKRRKEEEEAFRIAKELMDKEMEERKRMEEESMKTILAIQEEERLEQEQRRLKCEEENPTNCEICLDKIESADFLPLDRCGHLYHPKCLCKYFETEIDGRKFPLCCPSCKIEVSALDIRDILPPEGQRKWDEYTFKNAIESNPKDFSYCPTPDCPYVFVLGESENENNFTCPQCHEHYCLNCRCKYHVGQSCKEYQISNKFSVLLSIIIGRRQGICKVREGNEVQAMSQMSILGGEEPSKFA